MKLTRLKDLRLRKALTQKELAALAQISRTTIIGLEAGTVEPHPPTVRKLAEVLGVEPHELWEGERAVAA